MWQSRRFRSAALPLVFVVLFGNNRTGAQTGANVLVVVNDAVPAGATVAAKYTERRRVPAENVCHVNTTRDETVSRADYGPQIEQAIWQCIGRISGHDRVLYLVLMKGMPLRIAGTQGLDGTESSVDSELTLLYRRAAGRPMPVVGRIPNPYFAGDTAPATWAPFSHREHDMYLVTRLDGFTVNDALALVDRSMSAQRAGRFVLDERASPMENGNRWLREAGRRLGPDRVLLDESGAVVHDQTQVLGYSSWGTNDPAIRRRHFNLSFVPGALAAMFVSTDGRTFAEPPATWTPGEWNDPKTFFAGSPQSLTGDLIRDGVTGVAGHVGEPYLDATIRPDILFPAYARGMNLAEAFYLAMPYLSWQTIVVGDPLCAPFRDRMLPSDLLDPGIDSATEVPTFFASRRLSALPATIPAAARQSFIRADSRLQRGDETGARQALEHAVEADASFTAARIALAAVDERGRRFDEADAQYRAVLAYDSNEVFTLNNYAYSLAVRHGTPADALPLAQRAASLLPAPPMLDTLSWVLHLLSRDAEALKVVESGHLDASLSPDIRLHAIAILAGADQRQRARETLDRLLAASPSLRERADVRTLRDALAPVK
jgi:uncharacterized protein (TIGR03790 family)